MFNGGLLYCWYLNSQKGVIDAETAAKDAEENRKIASENASENRKIALKNRDWLQKQIEGFNQQIEWVKEQMEKCTDNESLKIYADLKAKYMAEMKEINATLVKIQVC